MTSATINLRTEWDNGAPTYVVTFTGASAQQIDDARGLADREGFVVEDSTWHPVGDARLYKLFEGVRKLGFEFKFEPEDGGPFNLQRLRLDPNTRERLERTEDFRLDKLAGYCPVQAEGEFDKVHFYFRARGCYWRFEAGGNESGTKGARWWVEEYWPGDTGFEAGYMNDEDAITCILKAVEIYRTSDRSRFQRGHPDYERTTLEGWSVGALSLPRVLKRLAISGEEALDRLKAYGIEVPYLADLELKALNRDPKTLLMADEIRAILTDSAGEED
ncbi:hypothetical protein AB4Z25_17950 [Rhizobium sp. RAF36]|uniref:hypothetical protein n=1 Tax=Rhizobium sp. RAF36 TaxID=3233055 RepID=UPI003F9AB8B3